MTTVYSSILGLPEDLKKECLTANFPEKEVASHLAPGRHGAAVCTTREGLVEAGTAKAVFQAAG